MNRKMMRLMGPDELEEYARACGIALAPGLGPDEMAETIAERRERKATVRALGLDLVVGAKSLRDKRVTDLMSRPDDGFGDDEAEELMRLVLGDEQYGAVLDAATDEDGTVDVDALGHAFARILTSSELKNY